MKADKNGLNPVLEACWWCGEDTGSIMLLQNKAYKIVDEKGDLPRRVISNMEPCDKCKDMMKKGCMFIAVQGEEVLEGDMPIRTGPMALLRDEAVEKMFNDEDMRDRVLKQRVCLIPDTVWDELEFPRADFNLLEE